MSKIQSRTAWSLATLAVAVAVSGGAQAGKPMNVVEKKAAAEAMRGSPNNLAPQLARKAAKTMTILPAAGGGEGMAVPVELHDFLVVSRDAEGRLRVLEQDGAHPVSAPAPEATHE